MFIDSHAHLTSEEMLPHLENILLNAQNEGIKKIVNICTDPHSLEKGLLLSEKFDWIVNTAATTPHDVQEQGDSFFPLVEKAAFSHQIRAIGETGLDYYYEHSPRLLQKEFLIRYLNLAKSAKLPVVIHCRNAFSDLFEIMDVHYQDLPLLIHCFTGTLEEAKEALKRNYFLSFSGIITFKKSQELKGVARFVPLDQMLIETDAPFLAPQSKRGKMNEPAFISETAACIADLKGCSFLEIAAATFRNAVDFFSL